MDPDACLSMIFENIADDQWDEAVTNAEALRDWLAKRGFAPGGGKLREESITSLLRWVINHAAQEEDQ